MMSGRAGRVEQTSGERGYLQPQVLPLALEPQQSAFASMAQQVLWVACEQQPAAVSTVVGLVARTIALCKPGAASCVKSTSESMKPTALRPSRYSLRDRAPAMQPT